MGLYEIFLEVAASFSVMGTPVRLRGHIDSINDSDEFLEFLEKRSSFVYFHLLNVVIPRTLELEELDQEIKRTKQLILDTIPKYEAAMSHLYVLQPEKAYEIKGGFSLARTFGKKGYRVKQTMRQRKLFHDSAMRKKKFIGILSAGLGGLNAVSCLKIFGVDVGRLTIENLFYGGVALFFSVSSMTILHLGLVDFINATRDSRVRPGRPIIKNLFPYGWNDKALWISVGIVIVDSLFSSIGLIQGLSPLERDDIFWKLAILCVSGFGSLVNVLLAWGVALDRINYEIQLKNEEVTQELSMEKLEEYIRDAQAQKDILDEHRRTLAGLERKQAEVLRSAKSLYEDFCNMLYGILLIDERDRRNHPSKIHPASSDYQVKSRFNGHNPKKIPSNTKNGEKDSKHP